VRGPGADRPGVFQLLERREIGATTFPMASGDMQAAMQQMER